MGRSQLSFDQIAKAIVEVGTKLADNHGKGPFKEFCQKGQEKGIYGTLPNKQVQAAPISWEFATKGEWVEGKGYVVYVALRQEAYIGMGQFRESDGFLPDYRVNDVLQWFTMQNIQLYPMPKKGLDRLRTYTHKFAFYIMPRP